MLKMKVTIESDELNIVLDGEADSVRGALSRLFNFDEIKAKPKTRKPRVKRKFPKKKAGKAIKKIKPSIETEGKGKTAEDHQKGIGALLDSKFNSDETKAIMQALKDKELNFQKHGSELGFKRKSQYADWMKFMLKVGQFLKAEGLAEPKIIYSDMRMVFE